MNEDDTVRRLKRCTFEELLEKADELAWNASENDPKWKEFFKENYWTREEADAESTRRSNDRR